jgi:membrane protein
MLQKLLRFILTLPIIAQFLQLLDRINFPGYPNISWLQAVQQFKKSMTGTQISIRAAAVSFNFFMAIFPSIIFLFTLTAYLPIDNFDVRLLTALREVLPPASYQAVKSTILDIISQQRGGLLSLGVLIALFYATNGVQSIISSFNASSYTVENRPSWKVLLVALALTVILVLLLVSAIVLMLVSNFALDFLIEKHIITFGINYVLIILAKWLIFYSLLLFSIAFLYYLGPPHLSRTRFFSIGAIITSFLILIVIVGFGFFVSNFGTYNTIYGSVGALIAVLVLINLNALLLLAGYEFNVGLKHLALTNKQ